MRFEIGEHTSRGRVGLQRVCSQSGHRVGQWRGERYDGTSTRTGPLESEKKLQTELKDNAKK